MANATSSYRSEDAGNGRLRFKVTPVINPPPFFSAIVTAGGMAVLFNIGAFSRGNPGFFDLLLAGGIAYAVFVGLRKWHRSKDKKMRCPGGDFIASPSGIESSGQVIAAGSIHRLVLRNGFSDVVIPMSGGGIVAGGTGAMGVGMAAGAAVGTAVANLVAINAQSQLKKNIAIGYKLDVEHGGNATTLAGGMTETTAYGLMQDVGKVLGLQAH